MYRQIGGYFLAELSSLWSRTFIFKERSVFVTRRMDWKGTPLFTAHTVCFLKEKVCKGIQLPPNSLKTVFSINQSLACDT